MSAPSSYLELTADHVFEQTHETYLKACRVADRLIDEKLTASERQALLDEHDSLIEQHASLGALYARLIQPDARVN